MIIACRNAQGTIEQAIRSAVGDENCDVEIVVVDGASTDATVATVEAIQARNLTVVSERDWGIGDAWNKGVERSTGSIISFLNADDYYDVGVLPRVAEAFALDRSPVIGFGDVTVIDENGNRVRVIRGTEVGPFRLLNGFGFLHPSVFVTRAAFEVVGPFDQRLRVAVDTEWLLRARRLGIAFRRIPSHTFMRSGGVSERAMYTGMGEYLDALLQNGLSNRGLCVFFLLRLIGALRRALR